MKAAKVIYIKSSKDGLPFAAVIRDKMINRNKGETLDNFKLRCEQLLAMMVQN